MAKGVSLAGGLGSLVDSTDLGGKSALDIIVSSGIFPSDIASRKDTKTMADYAARRPDVQRQLLRHAMGGYEFMPVNRAEHLYNEAKKHWIYFSVLIATTVGLGIGSLWMAPVLAAVGAGVAIIASGFAAYGAKRFKRHADYALAQTFAQNQQTALIQTSRDGQRHRVEELFKIIKPMCPNFVAMLPNALAYDTLPVAGKNAKGRVEGGTPGAQAMREAAAKQADVNDRRGKIGSGEKNYGSSSLGSMAAAQADINARRAAAAAKANGKTSK